MAKKFVINKSGVKALLQSEDMLKLTEKYANSYQGETKSFIGFDRAKTIVYEEGSKK